MAGAGRVQGRRPGRVPRHRCPVRRVIYNRHGGCAFPSQCLVLVRRCRHGINRTGFQAVLGNVCPLRLIAAAHPQALTIAWSPIQRLTEFEMKLKFARLSTAILGCAAALVFPASVASADPPDPHQPDMTKGYCPGGRWGFGDLAVCDGEKYPDGSFWHQWMQTWFTGPQFYFDCVSGGEPLPGPPPPGGCGGAIPSEQPNAP